MNDDVVQLRNEHAELYDVLTQLTRKYERLCEPLRLPHDGDCEYVTKYLLTGTEDSCTCLHVRARRLLQSIKMDSPGSAADARVNLAKHGITGEKPYGE